MSKENSNSEDQESGLDRALRTGLVVYTVARPVINAFLDRMSQRSEAQSEQEQGDEQSAVGVAAAPSGTLNRLSELAQGGRQQASEQLHSLQEQATQLEEQSKQLLKSLGEEAKRGRKQGRKMVKQVRKTGENVGTSVAGAVETSGKAIQDLAERGQQVLKPSVKQNRNLWMVLGFSVGLLAAAIATYLFVRRRVLQQATELDQHIELPLTRGLNDAGANPPVGAIQHVDDIGTAVSTMPVVDVENMEQPEGARFVGVASTKYYYPIEIVLPDEDLVYFISEEEAQAQGFTPATVE